MNDSLDSGSQPERGITQLRGMTVTLMLVTK